MFQEGNYHFHPDPPIVEHLCYPGGNNSLAEEGFTQPWLLLLFVWVISPWVTGFRKQKSRFEYEMWERFWIVSLSLKVSDAGFLHLKQASFVPDRGWNFFLIDIYYSLWNAQVHRELMSLTEFVVTVRNLNASGACLHYASAEYLVFVSAVVRVLPGELCGLFQRLCSHSWDLKIITIILRRLSMYSKGIVHKWKVKIV